MKKQYMRLAKLIGLVMIALTDRAGYGQTIPDLQWSKSGATITVVTDGNIAASVGGLPAGQIAGQGVIKYSLAGTPVWTTVLQGFTDLAGRFGLAKAPFQTVDNMVATADGGVVLYGHELGTGLIVAAKLNANGAQVYTLPVTNPDGSRNVLMDDLTATPDGGLLIVFSAFASPADTHEDTFITKYDSQGMLVWSRRIEYPPTNADGTDQSITKAEAVINALDGGYLLAGFYSPVGPANTVPVTPFDPVPNSSHATGWVAKLDGSGNVVWQKLLNSLRPDFLGGAPAPGALVAVNTLTDIIVAADGSGYALVGAGIEPSSLSVPPPVTALIELAVDGTYKRGRLNGSVPTKALLTLYKSGSTVYYAIGNTALQNGADPQLLLINPLQLNVISASRTFDSPSNSNLGALVVAGDGSLCFSTSQEIYKLKVETPAGPGLTINAPTYDCVSGQLTITASGVSGIPLEYQILGLRAWGTSPVFTIPTYQRTGTTFTLEVRQNGQSAALDFTSVCTASTTAGFNLLPPGYDCTTGQLTLQVAGASNGVEFRVAGLRDWGVSPVFTIPTYQRNGTTFTLEARSGGQVVQLPFATACGTTPPPASGLTLATPTLNCNSGGSAQLLINLAGIAFDMGNGIEYKVPGLADWQRNNAFTVPAYQTGGTAFTLYVRRVNTQAEFTTQFTANCPKAARQRTDEVAATLEAIVYPNPVDGQFSVAVRGAARQAVRFELSDSQGRLLQSRQVAVLDNYHQEIFAMTQPGAGLYILRVTTQRQAVVVNVIKR